MGDKMSDKNSPLEEMKSESAQQAKDPKTRALLAALLALWLVTLAALVGVGWYAYFDQKGKSQSLWLSRSHSLANAEKVIENQGKIQDNEVQEEELQEPEIQNPELQEPETQERENQEPEKPDAETQEAEQQEDEVQDPESQDPEIDDPDSDDPENQEPENQDPEEQDVEIQDDEVQDPEIQEDETQDPEINDPDPASPYTFTFVFTVPGNALNPDRTYTVTCNSGSGACTVSGG